MSGIAEYTPKSSDADGALRLQLLWRHHASPEIRLQAASWLCVLKVYLFVGTKSFLVPTLVHELCGLLRTLYHLLIELWRTPPTCRTLCWFQSRPSNTTATMRLLCEWNQSVNMWHQICGLSAWWYLENHHIWSKLVRGFSKYVRSTAKFYIHRDLDELHCCDCIVHGEMLLLQGSEAKLESRWLDVARCRGNLFILYSITRVVINYHQSFLLGALGLWQRAFALGCSGSVSRADRGKPDLKSS